MTTMTPEEFRQRTFRTLANAWKQGCFCDSPGFQKLMSFDFQKYGTNPVGLADTEILIDEIIRNRFKKEGGDKAPDPAAGWPTYTCPQCGATCDVGWQDYSISMNCSTVKFHGRRKRAKVGLYVIGFYGFSKKSFEKIRDFKRASSAKAYLKHVAGRVIADER
ncbi:MAG TPA: hypothetical protein P5081_22125 [Phycisphaerae bacterium]|nr:hypothetical protein [Phycisphaerae bacterium]HRW55579.1 hypothetical protein [Phycisphaerae bacterium]